MFGANLEPPKYVPPKKPRKINYDINAPNIYPYHYAHFARQPNSNYHVRLLEYKQKSGDKDLKYIEAQHKQEKDDAITIKYDKHTEHKTFERELKEKVNIKLKEYDEEIDKRRIKLRQLFCDDEEEFYRETVIQAQKGKEAKFEDLKKRAEFLEQQRECQRLEIVRAKRIQQYRIRSLELRPAVTQQTIIDVKNAQIIQMEENESRRLFEKETDKMWHEVMLKEMEAKKEREEQDVLERNMKKNALVNIWEKQIEGKRLLQEECEKVSEEDRKELLKLQEQLRREEIEALDEKRRKRDEICKDLLEQNEVQEKFFTQRKNEEIALDKTFCDLAQAEIDREKAKIKDVKGEKKRETARYRNYLRELEEERKQEEKKLNELLEISRKEIQKKQDEARCKIKLAKEELRKRVMEGRADQVLYNKQDLENQLKMKQVEIELMRMDAEAHERLEADQARAKMLAALQYRDDLTKQIEYNKALKLKEEKRLEDQLKRGLEEEEEYKQIALELIKDNDQTIKHPFRRVLERNRCYC